MIVTIRMEKERHRKKAKMGQNEGQRPKYEKREKNHDFFWIYCLHISTPLALTTFHPWAH